MHITETEAPTENQPREQADRIVEHHVLWHCALLASSEYATLRESESAYQLRGGLAVLPREDVPCHVSYEVSADREWYLFAAIAAFEMPSRTLRQARIAGPTGGPRSPTITAATRAFSVR